MAGNSLLHQWLQCLGGRDKCHIRKTTCSRPLPSKQIKSRNITVHVLGIHVTNVLSCKLKENYTRGNTTKTHLKWMSGICFMFFTIEEHVQREAIETASGLHHFSVLPWTPVFCWSHFPVSSSSLHVSEFCTIPQQPFSFILLTFLLPVSQILNAWVAPFFIPPATPSHLSLLPFLSFRLFLIQLFLANSLRLSLISPSSRCQFVCRSCCLLIVPTCRCFLPSVCYSAVHAALVFQ